MTSFITDLKSNRTAFNLFKEEAIKKGIYKNSPLSRMHLDYYDKYIKFKTNKEDTIQDDFEDNLYPVSKKVTWKVNPVNKSFDNYIPLKDLLSKGLNERVRDYLGSLDEH